jgi:hypothetical protein
MRMLWLLSTTRATTFACDRGRCPLRSGSNKQMINAAIAINLSKAAQKRIGVLAGLRQ